MFTLHLGLKVEKIYGHHQESKGKGQSGFTWKSMLMEQNYQLQ